MSEWLPNLVAWSLQATLLVVVGGALPWLLRLRSPRLRLAYWQMLLMLCLILPLLQEWRVPGARGDGIRAGMIVTTDVLQLDGSGAGAALVGVPWSSLILCVLGAGVIWRLVWVTAGVVRLHAWLAGSVPAVSDEIAELQEGLGTRADVRWQAGIDQPFTFGVRRPIVLLPATLAGACSEIQRAVLCHELVHVQRRDWAWVVFEEIVRAVLWFHPAIWWLIDRIRLSREQTVDQIAVSRTGARRAYLEALLTFAQPAGPRLRPATLFLRPRQLAERIALFSQEVTMTPRQVFVSCMTVAALTAGAGIMAVKAFPLETPSRAPDAFSSDQSGSASQPVEPGPFEEIARDLSPGSQPPQKIVHVNPAYPDEAKEAGVRASVLLRVVVDHNGHVAETRVLRNDVTIDATKGAAPSPAVLESFAQSATRAVAQWQFEPPADAPVRFVVSVVFRLESEAGVLPPPPPPPPPPVPASPEPPRKIHHVNPVYPADAMAAGLSGIVIVQATLEADGALTDVRALGGPCRRGTETLPTGCESLREAAVEAVRQWRFEPPAVQPMQMTMTVDFTLRRSISR